MNVWYFAALTACEAPLIRAQVPCVGSATVVTVDTGSFLLRAPRGWTFDCEAGKKQGPLTVLYRIGDSWGAGKAVMYVSVLTDSGTHPRPIAARINAEVADWRQRTPDARVTVLPPVITRRDSGVIAALRRFRSPAARLVEVVAYVPRNRVMPLLAMTARNDKDFARALPAFRRLVQSYEPVTLKVVP